MARVSGRELLFNEIHCHHITPYHVSKDDKYNNLAIVHSDIHKLIHTNEPKLFNSISMSFDLSQSQLEKA